MKELVGKTIKELYVSEDQSLLKFVTDQGELIYETDADCCSETWFADIIFNWKFFTTAVTEVTELEVPEWLERLINKDGRTRQEFDQLYGYNIKTGSTPAAYYGSNGTSCDIIFRNSSNGYYGGGCGLMDQSRDWAKKKLEETEWTQITEDWQA